jgi:hypothetical protein
MVARPGIDGGIMKTYDEIKTELGSIAAVVERFPEAVKARAFDVLVESFLAGDAKRPEHVSGHVAPLGERTHTNKSKPKTGKKFEAYKLDKDLDLRGNGKRPSFEKFYEEKRPKNAFEFNAVGVYYLKKMLELPTVSFDQLYTCYTEVKFEKPDHFRQSIIDTKNKKGWVDINEAGELDIPHRGVSFVEDKLPAKKEEKPVTEAVL